MAASGLAAAAVAVTHFRNWTRTSSNPRPLAWIDGVDLGQARSRSVALSRTQSNQVKPLGPHGAGLGQFGAAARSFCKWS